MVTSALAQKDNFNDGDAAGWNQYDPIAQSGLGGVATFSFPNGNSYRILTTNTPALAIVGPSRAGCVREDVVYTDFYVAVDIIDWNTNMDQSIGLLARVTQVGLGQTDGFALTYQVADGDIDITPFTNEAPGDDIIVEGDDQVDMVPGRSYRYEFRGQGTRFTARVYELPDLSTPVADVLGFSTEHPSGYCGLINFDTSGTGFTDATYDNYFAASAAPPTLSVQFLEELGELRVLWSTNATGYVLESTPRLKPEMWSTNDASLYEIWGDNYLFIEPEFDPEDPASSRLYRLVKPN